MGSIIRDVNFEPDGRKKVRDREGKKMKLELPVLNGLLNVEHELNGGRKLTESK